jgi:hypothetical protein
MRISLLLLLAGCGPVMPERHELDSEYMKNKRLTIAVTSVRAEGFDSTFLQTSLAQQLRDAGYGNCRMGFADGCDATLSCEVSGGVARLRITDRDGRVRYSAETRPPASASEDDLAALLLGPLERI